MKTKLTPMQAKDAVENITVTNPKEWETKCNEVFSIANAAIRRVEQTSVGAFEDQVVAAKETQRSAERASNGVAEAFSELRSGGVTLSGSQVKRVNAVREAAVENVKALRREADMLDHFAGQLADPEAYSETLFNTYSVLRLDFPHL